MNKKTFEAYYYLTKPGIIRGNLLAGGAGFLMATNGAVPWVTLLAFLVGTSFVIAAGCVFNNYIDRDIDKKMVRTKNRALVTHVISERSALIYGTILGALGFALLGVFTNMLTVMVGIVGFFSYVVVYGYLKRISPIATLVGAIPGATPPVAGYVAVTNTLDAGASILFLILACWQLPHFYTIAMFRIKDYTAAHIPVLPAVVGARATKFRIACFIVAFIFAALLLPANGYVGFSYTAIILAIGSLWLFKAINGFAAKDDEKWAKQVFIFSLIVLLVTCIAIAAGPLLP